MTTVFDASSSKNARLESGSMLGLLTKSGSKMLLDIGGEKLDVTLKLYTFELIIHESLVIYHKPNCMISISFIKFSESLGLLPVKIFMLTSF